MHRFYVFVFLSFFCISPTGSFAVTPEMQACAADADCVLVEEGCDGCCNYLSINKENLSAFSQQKQQLCKDYRGAVCECHNPVNHPVCQNSRCTLIEPEKKPEIDPERFKSLLPEESEHELDLDGYLDLQKSGAFTVLDVRSKESFEQRHIKNSINIPLTDLTEHTLAEKIPNRSVPVIIVCDYSFAPVRMIAMTMQAYPVLKASGYHEIYRLNLWHDPVHHETISEEEQEKHIAFEGKKTP